MQSSPSSDQATVPTVRLAAAEAPEPSVHEPPGRPWELELLISGAVVFALVQLPGWIDGVYDQFGPHLAGTVRRLAMMGYMISTMILYALITAFVVHLAARAYWVGLVGLDAVFPHGVRWERTRYGPIARGVRQEQQPSIQKLTDSADRFCSIIFSFAFVSAAGLALGTAVAVTVSLIAVGISRLAFDGARYGAIFAGIYAVLMAFLVIPPWIDRKWGDRLDPAGRPARLIRGAIRAQYAMMFARAYMPITDVLSSNVRRWAVVAVSILGSTITFGLFLGKVVVRDGGMGFAYDYLPARESASQVEYAHYLDQRPREQSFELEPAVQSEVIRGPFVRLFLPYLPRRHDALIEERCPEVRARGERPDGVTAAEFARLEAGREAAVLRCLAAMQPVRLNGAPIPDPAFRFDTRPASGLRGLVAYLPTAGLPPGENVLEVGAIPIAESQLERGEEQPAPHYIPFWIDR